MIDEGLRCAGSGLAVQRFTNYCGHVDWKQHSIYMNVPIFRAFHKDNGRACGLYAAQIGSVLVVGENLAGIECDVTPVVE